jgi:5'-nucleotidase (lipoprotein e(P4) family)
MDADETILDNSMWRVELTAKGLDYSPEGWNEWVGRPRKEDLVPGAADFIRAVAKRCGHIVVVTNRLLKTPKRSVDECAVTRVHLRELFGSDPIADVLCAEPNEEGKPINDKNPRFKRIENGEVAGLHTGKIVMYVGDSITDFPGMKGCPTELDFEAMAPKLGTEYFVLPNPMYGGWLGCHTPVEPRPFH